MDSYTKQLSVKVVSPAEQIVDQAKSELKREDINPSEITKMLHKPKRRRAKRTSKSNKKSGKIVKIKRKRTGVKKSKTHRKKNTRDIFQF